MRLHFYEQLLMKYLAFFGFLLSIYHIVHHSSTRNCPTRPLLRESTKYFTNFLSEFISAGLEGLGTPRLSPCKTGGCTHRKMTYFSARLRCILKFPRDRAALRAPCPPLPFTLHTVRPSYQQPVHKISRFQKWGLNIKRGAGRLPTPYGFFLRAQNAGKGLLHTKTGGAKELVLAPPERATLWPAKRQVFMDYFAALAALTSSISMGTTLNRSPQIP